MKVLLRFAFVLLGSGIVYGATSDEKGLTGLPRLSQSEVFYEAIEDSEIAEALQREAECIHVIKPTPFKFRIYRYSTRLELGLFTDDRQTDLVRRLLDPAERTQALRDLYVNNVIAEIKKTEEALDKKGSGLRESRMPSLQIEDALVKMTSCQDGGKKISQLLAPPVRFEHDLFGVEDSQGVDLTDRLFGIMSIGLKAELVKENYDFLVDQKVDEKVLEVCRTIMHRFIPSYDSFGIPLPKEGLEIYRDSVEEITRAKEELIMALNPECRYVLLVAIVHLSQLRIE
ncbi:MAG: hypothetical protein LBM19_01145 [Holosporales bacterium]|jgi:hypothetical protein|nr:hypothetical protein [Holosporales bacterium]